jgi:predicted Fe-S protein YdhL (DUF1289 family)
MKTPCVRICKLDTTKEYCIGCYRTNNQISNWWKYTDDERETIMHVLDLTADINKTFRRTLKLNPDGTLAHRVDKDVLHVVAIAIASDLLDTYNISTKNE